MPRQATQPGSSTAAWPCFKDSWAAVSGSGASAGSSARRELHASRSTLSMRQQPIQDVAEEEASSSGDDTGTCWCRGQCARCIGPAAQCTEACVDQLNFACVLFQHLAAAWLSTCGRMHASATGCPAGEDGRDYGESSTDEESDDESMQEAASNGRPAAHGYHPRFAAETLSEASWQPGLLIVFNSQAADLAARCISTIACRAAATLGLQGRCLGSCAA